MAAPIMIRKAEGKDISHIRNTLTGEKKMGNSAPPLYFRWVIKKGIALVAEKDRKRVGFLIAERNDKIAYTQLIYFFVHPRFRSKGVGSSLMNQFLKTCQQKGVQYIDLRARDEATGFYKKFGFRPEGKFTTMYKKI